jgi:hypothetical protein
MKAILLLLTLCLLILTGCSGGYQVNSYALSRNETPIHTRPSLEHIPYR